MTLTPADVILAARLATARPWCTALPLAPAAVCRALAVRAPKRELRLAVVTTEPEREHGLMNVAAVPAGEGMLFAFPDGGDRERYFWMKDTIAPLDMVFVRADGLVSAVAADVPATAPGTGDADVARRNGLGRYVIELRAGEAGRAGITAGTRLAIPAIPAQ